jgi:tetratricopeptide (TPR) repeat protein
MDAKATLTILARIAEREPDQAMIWLEQSLHGRMKDLAEIAIQVAVETEAPIGALIARQLEEESSPELILKVAATCDLDRYSHSVALWEVAQVSARRALDLYQQLGDDALSLGEKVDVARLANNLSQRLLSLGHKEEALRRAREAVTLNRALAAVEPIQAEVLPRLVGSLLTLGNSLTASGFLEESLRVGQEATALGKELHSRERDSWKGLYPATLANLGFTLNKLNRYEDAALVNREAVELSRQAPALVAESFIYPQPLAGSLINLGMSLLHLGSEEEALAAAREAYSLIQELWNQRPDIFSPLWLEALEQLAAILSFSGDPSEALRPAREAALACRDLVTKRSAAFRPHYAFCLLNLSSTFMNTGQLEQALSIAREAVLQFGLAERQSPESSIAAFAQATSNLSGILLSLGQPEEALAEAENAVELLQNAASPERISSYDLGYCLYNLSLAQAKLNRIAEAIGSLEKAIYNFRDAPAGQLFFIDPKVSQSLRLLGSLHAKAGRHDLALQVTLESLEIARSLARQRPRAFQGDLAECLGNLGNRWADCSRLEESLLAHEESIHIYRELKAKPSLALGLNNLGQTLIAMGSFQEAILAFEEALSLITPFLLERPAAFVNIACALFASYRDAARDAGREPDPDLLAPICQVLETFIEPAVIVDGAEP